MSRRCTITITNLVKIKILLFVKYFQGPMIVIIYFEFFKWTNYFSSYFIRVIFGVKLCISYDLLHMLHTWVPSAGIFTPGPNVGLNLVISRAATVCDGGVDCEVNLPQVAGLLSSSVVHSPTYDWMFSVFTMNVYSLSYREPRHSDEHWEVYPWLPSLLEWSPSIYLHLQHRNHWCLYLDN